MSEASQATLVVTLRNTDGFEATKKRILRIRGVGAVELNYMSRKLRVRYDGNKDRSLKVLAEIRKTIAPYL